LLFYAGRKEFGTLLKKVTFGTLKIIFRRISDYNEI